MSRILVVSEDPNVAERLEAGSRETSLQIRRTTWSNWEAQEIHDPAADILLFDYRTPSDIPGDATHRLAAELRRGEPDVPVVLVADVGPLLQETIQAAIGGRNVSFTAPQVFVDAAHLVGVIREVRARYGADKQASRSTRANDSAGAARAFPHLVPELRNPKTGRLDAKRVADLFAIPLKRLATALNADPAAVYKTPDAAGLQESLRVYERIARVLLRLVGSDEGLRIWLNTPEPDLDNEIPRDLLLNGEGEVVAELLEDMQEGQPA